jgi:hypothetical protein
MAGDIAGGMAEVMAHGTEAGIMAEVIITMEEAIITRVLDIILIFPIIMEDPMHTHFIMDTMLSLPGMERHARIIQVGR